MRIVTLSDTHCQGSDVAVPDGDVLVHAGDHTFRGTQGEVDDALQWLDALPHRHKLLVAGNHDWFFDPDMPTSFRGWSLRRSLPVDELLARYPRLTYLQDSGVDVDGLRFWGSPWQPYYWGWAFNFPQYPSGEPRRAWEKIPADTQVLITHSPPFGILDTNEEDPQRPNGCPALRARVNELLGLRLHIFGHIHEGYGQQDVAAPPDSHIVSFINASICTREYRPTNPPIVIDL